MFIFIYNAHASDYSRKRWGYCSQEAGEYLLTAGPRIIPCIDIALPAGALAQTPPMGDSCHSCHIFSKRSAQWKW